MNIFRKYTRKSLAVNKSRTLVTVIGIILSMALLTAVIEGAYSGVRFLADVERANSGNWEIYFSDMDSDKLAKLSADSEVKKLVSWKNVGFAEVDKKSENDRYYIINSVTDDFKDMVSINLLTGRLPENDTEIIIPHNGQLGNSIGDIIKYSVGKRVSDSGERLVTESYQEGEKLVDTTERSYTVVGVYQRLNQSIVPYSYPGYVAITKGGDGDLFGSFVTLKNTSKAYDFFRSRCQTTDSAEYISSGSVHSDLLTFYGSVRDSSIQSMLYGFAAILVVMVAFGSVSLIYNSFSISLAERTKQFGILKSIGATKKQLRSSVLYEALVLGCIGIPAGLIVGCAGIGITLYLLRGAFASFAGGTGVEMRMVLSPVALLIAAVICLVVILISAWIPAGRAVRIPPIQAVRQNEDTRIKAREVKTSKLTQKLFGFEGMMAAKNFKRNSKRYRATILSLFMSVVLFISASSFCSYLTDSVKGIVSDGVAADVIYADYGMDFMTPDEFREVTSSIAGIDKLTYTVDFRGTTSYDPTVISDRFWQIAGESVKNEAISDGYYDLSTQVAFVDDAEFNELLKKEGLDQADFYDSTSPKGVLYNKLNTVMNVNNSSKWFSVAPVDTQKLPVTISLSNEKYMDGYINYSAEVRNGKRVVIYYPEEYYIGLMDSDPVSWYEKLDISKALIVPYEESVSLTELKIGAEVKSVPMLVSSNSLTLMYPYSMMHSVFNDKEAESSAIIGIQYGINSKNHAQVCDELKKAATENGLTPSSIYDLAEERNTSRMILTVVNVFAYGFIILISLIALANVFNTISTSIMLRRREFAMLQSIGLSRRGFSKMMNYECLIYGARSLMFGLPVAVVMTYLIWRVTSQAFETGFYLPWRGVVIAVASVFIVVFATMLYATSKIRSENTIDALKNENL